MLLSALALSACAPAAARPHVVVNRATWTGQTEEAGVFSIEMEVSNPGEIPLELREMHYRVSIGNQPVYSGRRSTAQTVAPGGTARVWIPAVVRRHDGAAVGAPARFSVVGDVVYMAPGRLALVMRDLGFPPPRTGFRGAGAVDIE